MLLIGNGRVITRDNENPFIENGCIVVDGNLIKEIGVTDELKKKYIGFEYIDAKGGVIMPGLINTHNHIYSAMARGLSVKGYNPKNFMDILHGLWWELDYKLNIEQIKQSADVSYIDCIKNGVTTVFDHHASYGAIKDSLFVISESAKNLGVRTCLCYEVSDRHGEDKMKEAVKENVEFINATIKDNSEMVKGMIGLHAAFTLSNETLEYCATNKPDEVGYHIHVAEGIDDIYDSLQRHGKRVVNRLFDMNILGKKTIAAHCIHINNAEIEILKNTDTVVVHNPESNMGNAVGCPPVLELMEKGVMVGLGTDGYTNDMVESMKVANILHKHNKCNPSVAWGEIPTILFDNNRTIANRYFNKTLGVIKKGACADIIVTDYNPLTPMDASNIDSHILFGMNGRSVTSTIINGKVLMKDRVLVNIDEEEVLEKSRELAKKLWRAINK